MTEQEKQWFDALTKNRSSSADVLEMPHLRGVQRSVVDKYSDQAHFIYELLQNADDAQATTAHFRLVERGLYFTHDGPVRFTVSNPETEETDTKDGTLGHINAITSIANSNKNESSIGKFGVGFKAVFQYTQTPHIYDPEVRFKIERFIVPHLIEADLNGRKTTETAFFFPFDHKTKQPQESYEEIRDELKSLEFPLLFLSSLVSVEFEVGNLTGKYTKKPEPKQTYGDITAQWLSLELETDGKKTTQCLLVFTRNHESRHPFSIGYAMDGEGKLTPISRPAFCFFPTKVTTNLKFIFHAPFLLTDSREGIKAGEPHNQELIQRLAKLAADSLPILRDVGLIGDGILEIIPYDETKFSGLDDRSQISFKPFFTAIKMKFQTDTLLPAANGKCSSRSRSYWASDTDLVELFSDEQLERLTGTTNATWVFRDRGKKEVVGANKPLADYIDGGDNRYGRRRESNLILSSLDPEALLTKITADFIKQQQHRWLHKFYRYLVDRPSYQKLVKDKPIFIDSNGNAVAAFDSNNQLILFLPDNNIEGYVTVSKALLSNGETCQFIEKFGIKTPSIKDEIYNNIIPAYRQDESIDTYSHFDKFFRYYKECKNEELDEFIGLIKNLAFLSYSTEQDKAESRGNAEDIYFPNPELKAWFETKPNTRFLCLDKYYQMVDQKDQDLQRKFFSRLGVSDLPRVISREVNRNEIDANLAVGGHSRHFHDKHLDGCDPIIENIKPEQSVLLWRFLTHNDLLQDLRGSHTWSQGGRDRKEFFKSSEEKRLQTAKWILNKAGDLVSANSVTKQTLSDQYDTSSPGALALIKFLEIRDDPQSNSHLSSEEQRKIKLADEIEKSRSGLSDAEIIAAIEEAKRKKTAQSSPPVVRSEGNTEQVAPVSPLAQEIEKRRPSVMTTSPLANQEQSAKVFVPPIDANEDSDDYTPKAVDFGKKLNRAKDRHANELDRIEREQSLHEKVNSLPRYSYGRLLALLELECMESSEKYADAKTVSISFDKIAQDSLSSRTIILKEPNRFIPQSIEEMTSVPIHLDFRDGKTGKLRVESFTAREFTLLAKLGSSDGLDEVNLEEVVEARIEVQNPSFLLQELLARFRELNLDEHIDMKENLTANIEFVFGPPGTGKTTYLAERVLIPMMSVAESKRVLVLAPTNKAADVLTTRIMERMGTDTSYLNWLIRFGTSVDERIEKAGVWQDRSFDIGALDRSITVTTIARFAYDGFAGNHGKKLYEMKWHAIVIDEASMISLASIIYPLYQKKHSKFIIAGDPFQIEPIVAVEQLKDENIYTLVGLNKPGSFANPSPEPHGYKVTNLETQYRSIPAIGQVFSRFTYDGILKHHRQAGEQRPLNLKDLEVKPLNLIKFPVSKFESIYRAKRLESGTPYQTYSALFTFEFVRWLAREIQVNHGDKFRIGVIAPYRAQASLLSRLNDSWAAKPNTVEIQVGTIHGFQGDECDIVIAVFNPPPSISNDKRMFLNKQNILNVAISRARDYLFIVMPDEKTEGFENLCKISQIENLVKSGDEYREHESKAIEQMIWGNPKYLEENTFSTGHQMVNVYRKPERHYDVRSDNSAIDIQVHEKDS